VEWYDHGHDGPPRVCRIQLHCTDTLQLQVLGSGTITATTAPLVFVEYNYIVPTPAVIVPLPRTCSCKVSVQCSCILQTRGVPSWPWSYHSQEPAAVRCRYNVVVFYKHEGGRRGHHRTTPTFGSWEWYDHDHDGTPRVCRIQLHCTETTQYNYIVKYEINLNLLQNSIGKLATGSHVSKARANKFYVFWQCTYNVYVYSD
jgi:hypothetical protein